MSSSERSAFSVNSKKLGGGGAVLLSSCHTIRDEVMVVKPSCNYHFWCLQQVKNKNFWGCIRMKNFALKKNFSCKN